MRIALSLTTALAIAAPAAAQPAKTTVVDTVPGFSEVDRTTTTQNIAFKNDRYERMTVPVKVSGRGPYRFLVDTGADRTVLSTAMAAQLKLVEGPAATLHSVTGTSAVRTVAVPRFELSADRVHSIDAPLLEAQNMGADGILGVDSLRSQRVMFDFKAKTLSIVPSAKSRMKDDEGTIVVEGKLRRGHLIVTSANVQNTPVTVVLDTGAEMTMGNEAMREKLESRRKLAAPEPVVLMSVTGERLVGSIYFIKELSIGGISLKHLAVVFSDAETFRTLGLSDRPALLLGMNAMRAFDKVSIDFARKKLRVMLPEQSSREDVRMASR